MKYYRLRNGTASARLVAQDGDRAYDLSSTDRGIDSFTNLATAATSLDTDIDSVARSACEDAEPVAEADIADHAVLPALPDEVWAAGVTYAISEEARKAESSLPELYYNVYTSERPELFFKATPSRVVGPTESVGIRADSDWNVPEPELGLVLLEGTLVGYLVGNDMSSRSIEGENPLYLPQAKVYERCCSLGPCIASPETVGDSADLEISMRIERDQDVIYEETTSTSDLVRTFDELTSYYTRHNEVPELAVLLTGTSLVPGQEFTLRNDDWISITIENIGTLENSVVTV